MSRYWLDFYPSFVTALIILFLFILQTLKGKTWLTTILLTSLVLCYCSYNQVDPKKWQRDTATKATRGLTYTEVINRITQPRNIAKYSQLAASYSCKEFIDEDCDKQLSYNKQNWDYKETCLVQASTFFYLPYSECLTLKIQSADIIDFDEIQIRSNIDEYSLNQKILNADSSYDLKYCRVKKLFNSKR